MSFPLVNPFQQFVDSSGSPLVSGTIEFRDPTTNSLINTYPTADDADAQTNANDNPLTLSSYGASTAGIYLEDGVKYKVILKDAQGATVTTQDDVLCPIALPYTQTAAESAAGVTPTNVEYPPGNVLRYGTNTTPGTTDMSTAAQAAIDSSDKVYFPEGDYAMDSALTLRSDSFICGAGIGATKIIKNADVTGGKGVLEGASGSSSTFLSNIQIRDLEIDGLVGTKSFSEFQHLVSLRGVDGLVIENVKFTGPQGDAIYLGSTDASAVAAERHNHNVTITNCIFDGVNNDNRNCITVIDCDGLIFSNNHCYDHTKSTMPGAVDVEPNNNAYHVVNNIQITGNTFENITGSAGAINFILTATTFTNQPESFIVSNNVFDVAVTAIVFDSDANYGRPIGMVFSGNSGKVNGYADFQGRMEGLIYSNNNFYATGRGYLGFNAADEMIDATITGNVITGDASTAKGWVLRSGNNISFSGNIYKGLVDYTYQLSTTSSTLDDVLIANEIYADGVGVEIGAGTISGITISNCDFSNLSSVIEGAAIPSDTRISGCRNWKTTNAGTASVATGGTVSHGLAATPDVIMVMPTVAGLSNIYVNGAGSTTFAINFDGGGTNSFFWLARMEEEYI